jgi:predicted transcriptional regulator
MEQTVTVQDYFDNTKIEQQLKNLKYILHTIGLFVHNHLASLESPQSENLNLKARSIRDLILDNLNYGDNIVLTHELAKKLNLSIGKLRNYMYSMKKNNIIQTKRKNNQYIVIKTKEI